MPRYTAAQKEDAFQLFKRGRNQSEISRDLDIPRVTLARWASTHKWEERVKVERFGGKPLGETPGTDLTFSEKQDRFRDNMAVQALRLPEIMSRMDDDELMRNADKIKSLDGIARKALNLEEAAPATVINVALLSRPVEPVEAIEVRAEEVPALPAESEPQTLDADLS